MSGAATAASAPGPGPATPPAGPSMAERLRGIVAGPRADLETSRHVFHGRPTYVVRDPVTFQAHAFEPEDYELLVRLDGEEVLGEKFDALVEAGSLAAEDEDQFYDFVIGLHRLGLLALPINDDRMLYERYERKRAADRRGRVTGFLFLRVPLWNPDRFLAGTVRFVRPLFSTPALVLWLLAVVASILLAASRWSDLSAPVLSVFDAETLPLLWVLLIGLKAVHEFGHAWACRVFGGRVPEMGVFMILFTPCAYVDASASWAFTRRRHRLVVNLAGMYFESIVAMGALLVWASTGPSLVNTAAYQVLLLASVVTVLFNLNPLARFDGYYVLSDLAGIPNLRARGAEQVQRVATRVLLGLRRRSLPYPVHVRAGLFAYGCGSAVYRVSIVLGIAAVLSTRSLVLGLLVGGIFVGMMVVGGAVKAWRFLLHAEDTAPVRGRAVVVAAMLFLGLPALVAMVPLPSAAEAQAVVQAERHAALRATTPGFLAVADATPGATIAAGGPIARLDNPQVAEEWQVAEAEARLAALRLQAAAGDGGRAGSPAATHQAEERLRHASERAADARRRAEELVLASPIDGRVLRGELDASVGRFFDRGELVAEIGAGDWLVVAVVPGEVAALTDLTPGTSVRCMAVGRPRDVAAGVIERVSPAGSRQLEQAALGTAGGGTIPVDPASGTTSRVHFELVIRLDPDSGPWMHDETVVVRFEVPAMTMAQRLGRQLSRFINASKVG